MTNKELRKILEWADKKGNFTWNDLQKQFGYDNQKMARAQNALRSNMPISKNLVDHLYISGGDPNLLVITSNGRLFLTNLRNQKSPFMDFLHNPWIVGIGLLLLGAVKWLDLGFIKSPNLYWIVFSIIAGILLFLYWHTKNAVWGGLTIGLIIGLLFLFYSFFNGSVLNWYVVGKGAIIGTLVGFGAELLGKFSDFLKNK
ncbi:MAG: hypothetical protein Q8R26_02985 [bacterium]|nr:hypothetical protein [bacterium]